MTDSTGAEAGPDGAGVEVSPPPTGAEPLAVPGPGVSASQDGCSCRTGRAAGDAPLLSVALVLGGILVARRRWRRSAAALVVGLLALETGPAHACKIAFLPFEVEPSLRATDTRAPAMTAGASMVSRGQHDGDGCLAGSTTSCEGLATISIPVTVNDDQSTPEQIGFKTSLVRGTPPEGLVLPAGPVRGSSGFLSLSWFEPDVDQRKPFSFVLSVAPVDRAGNVGVPLELTVSDGGTGGCAVARGGSSALPILLLTAPWLALRRRPRRVTAGLGC